MTEHSNLHTLVDIVSIAASLALTGVVLWWSIWQDKRIQAIKSDVARLMREYPVPNPAQYLVLQEWMPACCGTRVLIQERKDTIMLNLKLGDVRTLQVKPKDANGNPAMLDGAASWASSDPTAVLIEANADGISATLRVLKAGVDVDVSVSGDGAQGDVVHKVSGNFAVHVYAADAVNIEIVALGEPAATPTPTAPPAVVDVPAVATPVDAAPPVGTTPVDAAPPVGTTPVDAAPPEALVSGSPAAPATDTATGTPATDTVSGT